MKEYQSSPASRARVEAIQAEMRAGKRARPLDAGTARAELERLTTPMPMSPGEMREAIDVVRPMSRVDAWRRQMAAEGHNPAYVETVIAVEVEALAAELTRMNPQLQYQPYGTAQTLAWRELNQPIQPVDVWPEPGMGVTEPAKAAPEAGAKAGGGLLAALGWTGS